MAYVRKYLMNSLITMKHSKHVLKFNKKNIYLRETLHTTTREKMKTKR